MFELALTGTPLDRLAHRRDDESWQAAALDHPSSRMICVAPGTVLTTGGPELSWQPTVGVPHDPTQAWLFLGHSEDGVHRFALAHRPDHPYAADPAWRTLRDVAGELNDLDGMSAAAGVALANWHSTHPRCPRCGAPTRLEGAGWLRRCPIDGSEHYPRTDPAVIMAVIDADDRILLGHSPAWPENRFSTLAGFVEPGETLEAAVRREVAEEVGVPIGEVTYLASQPWPFPASLMIGCEARALDVRLTLDAHEIIAAQWFSQDEFTAAVLAGRLLFPPTSSISRRLIERWYGGELPQPPVVGW